MTAICGLLILTGIVLLLILYCICFLKNSEKQVAKDAAKGTYYDERQIAAHGKANAFTVGVGIIYYLIVSLVIAAWERENFTPVIAPSNLVMAGAWLMIVSYFLCCLMTDSVIPLGNYSFPAVIYIVVGMIRILMGVLADFLVAMGNDDWNNLIIGFAFLTMGAIHLIARSRSKRETE